MNLKAMYIMIAIWMLVLTLVAVPVISTEPDYYVGGLQIGPFTYQDNVSVEGRLDLIGATNYSASIEGGIATFGNIDYGTYSWFVYNEDGFIVPYLYGDNLTIDNMTPSGIMWWPGELPVASIDSPDNTETTDFNLWIIGFFVVMVVFMVYVFIFPPRKKVVDDDTEKSVEETKEEETEDSAGTDEICTRKAAIAMFQLIPYSKEIPAKVPESESDAGAPIASDEAPVNGA